MKSHEEFREAYPLTLVEALHTLVIHRNSLLAVDPSLPLPSTKGARPFLDFCGYSDSAIRTALSRARRSGVLLFPVDPDGTERMDMPSGPSEMDRFYREGADRGEGFTLAAFSFETRQHRDRYVLKEILRYFGFVMLTGSTYVSRRIDPEPVRRVAEKEGLAENLFLFSTDGWPDLSALARIAERFDALGWTRRVEAFRAALEGFLAAGEDAVDRAPYAGAAHHLHVFRGLPPLPETVFPGKAAAAAVRERLAAYYVENTDALVGAFRERHGGKA